MGGGFDEFDFVRGEEVELVDGAVDFVFVEVDAGLELIELGLQGGGLFFFV